MAEVQLPSNSNKSKEIRQEAEKRVSKPVVRHAATTRKKSLGTKFAETFISEDATDVKGYLLTEVVVPTIKDLISTMVISSVEMLLYGEARGGGGPRRYSTNSRTSYSSYYSNRASSREPDRGGVSSKSIYNYDEILVDTKQDADLVVDSMIEMLEEYGVVRVSDLYDLVDKAWSWADCKYGWKDLNGVDTPYIPREHKYLIKLPKARAL